MSDVNNLIMGASGPPAAKFTTINTWVHGTITATAVTQQRDFKTKDFLWWGPDNRPTTTPSDRPMNQAVITIQTDHSDPTDPDDDGQRRLFLGGRNIRDAVRDALHVAKVKQIEVGGELAVAWTGGAGEAGDPKQYVAKYKAPGLDIDLLSTPAGAKPPTSLLADEAPF